MTITIVTHAALVGGAPDDLMLADAFIARGAKVRFAVWNDPAVDWSASDLTVIRSTWDYHLHPAAWFDWINQAAKATRLINPPEMLRWNSRKTYLLDLDAAGVDVVPTVLLESEDRLAELCRERGWADVVIKPTIGASSLGARRFREAEIGSNGSEHAQTLLALGGALLQPYRAAVETAWERALVFFDGAYSHAFSKPAFHAGLGGAAVRPHIPRPAELALAGRALAALSVQPTVARIDLLPGTNGPELMEIELIEPQLALHLCSGAVNALADVLVALADDDEGSCSRADIGPRRSKAQSQQ